MISTHLDAGTLVNRARGDTFLAIVARYTFPPDYVTRKPGEGREYATRCPFGCGSRHDALRLWPDKLPAARWWCRRCGESGDILAFVQKARRLSFPAAIDEVARLLGDAAVLRPVIAKTPGITYQHVVDVDMTRWQAAAGVFVKSCADRLWSHEGKPYRENLQARGLTEFTIRHARLGCLDEMVCQTPENWGIDRERRIWPGLVIPYLDGGGTVHAVKIRTESGHPKWLQVYRGGGYVPPFGSYSPAMRPGAVVILQEAEIDSLLGAQFGPTAAWLALPAGQPLRPSALPENATLILALDDDDAGRAATEKLHAAHPGAIVAPPFDGAKDLSELYQKSGSQAVTDWITATLAEAMGEVAY